MGTLRIKGPKPKFRMPKIPDECTWLLLLGLDGDPVSKRCGDAYSEEAKRRGKPFVPWTPGAVFEPRDIVVIVMYAGRDILAALIDKWGYRTSTVPLIRCRSNISGEGFAGQGGGDPTEIAKIFDDAQLIGKGQ